MILLPHVEPAMLSAAYWLERLPDPDASLLSPTEIAAYNQRVHRTLGYPNVLDLPDVLPAEEVLARLPVLPARTYYHANGTPHLDTERKRMLADMALDAIPPLVQLHFGLVTERTSLRIEPTMAPALDEPGDFYFDRLQETAVDVGWPLAVAHTSADGGWFLAFTPLVFGWVRAEHVALAADPAVVTAYVEAESFLRVTAPRAGVAVPDGRHVLVQTGTRLPLTGQDDQAYHLRLPRRTDAGGLVFVDGYVARDDPGWVEGDAPLTARTLFNTAFAILGERYGWGCDRLGEFGRDCSRYARDVYAVTGITLPRNSGAQRKVGPIWAEFDEDEDNAARIARLADAPPGALLHLPGHVMLHLGVVDGIPYAIHDLWNYRHPEGHVSIPGAVVVSALPPEPSALGHTLLERLSHVQVVAAPEDQT